MMYRAQIQGRCNLQFAGKNTDLEKWQREWLSLNNRYQIEAMEGNKSLHTIEIQFPYRVFSNCGQDSILRPTIRLVVIGSQLLIGSILIPQIGLKSF